MRNTAKINKRRAVHCKNLILLLFLVLFSFIGNSGFSQTNPGINLSWNINVGCGEYKPDLILIENIGVDPHDCVYVCEGSRVTYTLTGTLGSNPNVVWTIVGGTAASTSSTTTTSSVVVNWGTNGDASISFTMNGPSGGIITKLLCVKVKIRPTAAFSVLPIESSSPGTKPVIYACVNQELIFTDHSLTNGGSPIAHHYWTFGDGGTAPDVLNPSHTYSQPGIYNVILTVTNECGCVATYGRTVVVRDEGGFEISCPSVVCDGQTSTYNLPFNGQDICEVYNYTVDGGHIVSQQGNGEVTVTWDNVDATGFGYLTFNPSHCNLECLIPTSIRIPVIQTNGTIQGPAVICTGSQIRYMLPQWPTTDFTWTVLGNVNNSLAQVMITDQRNEVIIQPAHSGTITLMCTYQNTLLHCGGTAILTIQVNDPEPVTGPTSLCINSSGSYITTSTHAVDWTLRKNNVIVNTAASSNSYTYIFNTAGTYSLTVSGPNVCDNQTISILITPMPRVPLLTNITAPAPLTLICPSAPYNYFITIPNPNMDYHWSVAGGTIIGSDTDTEVNVSFDQSGFNQLYLTQNIAGQPNCVSPQLVIPINVFSIKAVISNDKTNTPIPTSMSSCANVLATYYAVNTNVAGLYNIGETYTWSITPSNLGSITTGQGTDTVTVQWNNVTSATTATLSLIITKCTLTSPPITKTVNLLSLPALTLNVTNACSGANVHMVLSSSNGVPFNANTTINWNFGDGGTATQTLPAGPAVTSIIRDRPFWINNTGNINYTITATITTPNNCTGSVTTAAVVMITPGPIAQASIFSGGNVFCNPDPITTVLSAATTTGATVTWYSTAQVALGTGGSFSPTVPGNYYFIATLNGCSTESNKIIVAVMDCTTPTPCILNPMPIVNVHPAPCPEPIQPTVCDKCGILDLLADTDTVPLSANWTIIGPNLNIVQESGPNFYQYSTPISSAGYYHVNYRTEYLCEGVPSILFTRTTIAVPYVPSFTTAVTCSGSTYTVVLNDTSSFITTVHNREYFYSYRIAPSNIWVNIASPSSSPTATFTTSTFGTYFFRLKVKGILPPATTPSITCSTINPPLTLAAPPTQTIIPSENSCFNSAVKFAVSGVPIPNETYLWTFDTSSLNLPHAESTLPITYRVFDPTIDGSAHTVIVTLQITNRYGCTRTLPSVAVVIPARCYFGDIVTSTPTICKNGTMILNYQQSSTQPDNSNCAPYQYQWMNGSSLVGTTSVPTYSIPNVSGTNFYWVKLISNSTTNSCDYKSPGRITPSFLPLPTAEISAPSIICQGNAVSANATTNGAIFYWSVDTVQQNNNLTSIPLGGFTLGTHTLRFTSTSLNGCIKFVQQSFTVNPSPDPPTATFNILDCDTYKIELVATPPAGGAGAMTWSSGTIGNPTIVHHGGPFMVTYNNGSGCNSTYQIDVPQSLERYMWIFPTGCYTMCDNNPGTLIGPNLSVEEWNWFYESNNDLSGNGFVQPYQPAHTGLYNLSLHSACHEVSGDMNLTVNRCEECEIRYVKVDKIFCNDEGLMSYHLAMTLENSGSLLNVTISVPGNEVIISPASIAVQSGINPYFFDLIPINGFTSGTVTFIIMGTDPRTGRICTYKFEVDLPFCERPRTSGKTSLALANTDINSLLIYPNPTQGEVNVKFESQDTAAVIEVYDLTGKKLGVFAAPNKKGTVQIPLNNFAAGIYVVALKENGEITMQKKLIIN